MNFRSILSSSFLILISASLTGCGSSTKVTSTNERSAGQQLTDLNEARQQGLITEKEYARLRKAIIKKND
jgi:hypothetical protein